MNEQKNLWRLLLDKVVEDDGLPVRDSGYWAKDKLCFWHRYVDMVTKSMVGKPHWPGGIVYVDLFSGPGICVDRDSGERFPGSPLIAANASKPFSKILLCELDQNNASACESRLSTTYAKNKFEMFVGDCNETINELTAKIPRSALTLAFIDPTGLHVQLETVKKLAKSGATDALILFPVAQDVMRNANYYYFSQEESKLDMFLGSDSNWRDQLNTTTTDDPVVKRKLFAKIYKEQLNRHCGFTYFGEKVIERNSAPLYRLIFATQNELAIKFWNESLKKDSQGQKGLPF